MNGWTMVECAQSRWMNNIKLMIIPDYEKAKWSWVDGPNKPNNFKSIIMSLNSAVNDSRLKIFVYATIRFNSEISQD